MINITDFCGCFNGFNGMYIYKRTDFIKRGHEYFYENVRM